MRICDQLRGLQLAIAVTALLLPAAAAAGTAGALPFVAVGGVDQGAADNISALLSSELDIAGDWELVISADSDEITDGCSADPGCWQAFGKGEGHTHVIAGTVAPKGEDYEVTARLHEVGSGRLVRQVVKTVSRKPGLLVDQVASFAAELATGEASDADDDDAVASRPRIEEPDFDEFDEEDGEADEEDEADKPKWMNRDRRGRLIKAEEVEEEDDPFGDLGDEDLDLDELDGDTQRRKAEERREREAREAARKAEEEAERRRVEDERRQREENERRRAEEERERREEERRQAEAETRRRQDEERQARAERERRDELRQQAEEREAREEQERRARAEQRREEERQQAEEERREEERRAEARKRADEEERREAAEERRKTLEREEAEEQRRASAAERRRGEERSRVEADRQAEERRAADRRRAEVERAEEEDDDDEGGFALRSAIEDEDDGFVIEDDDPGFVIEEEGDEELIVEDEDQDDVELREGEIITYGEEDEEEDAPVSRRRDDYDPYARAKSFERDDDEEEAPRPRSYDRRERSYERIDRSKDAEPEEEEGDFDRLEAREDDRLAYNADGYPDRRDRSADDDTVRARPSDRSYDDDEDEGLGEDYDSSPRRDEDEYADVSRYGGRGGASRSARATTTSRGPADRRWVSVRAHVGYTNYYLHFAEFGLDVGVLVHPQIAIDLGVDFWAVGLTVQDVVSGQEIQQVHTLPNFSVGGSWRGDFHKIIKPFVGADFTTTIYATVRLGTPDGPMEPRASAGFMVKGGSEFVFKDRVGFHVGLKGGVMYAEEIGVLVSSEWASTQGVFSFNGGLSLRF